MTAPLARWRHAHRPRPTLRRLGAGLVLAAVTAGPPALLVLLAGSPLRPPEQLQDRGALTAALDDQTVLWLLAAVAWLLWTHLLGTLLIELLRQTRGSTLRMPMPGLLFGANTALASHVIATLLLTGQPAAAHGLTPATIRVAHTGISQPAPVADRPPQLHGPAPAALVRHQAVPPAEAAPVECRVLPPDGRDHDTLWDIAVRHLGDGTRWRDIYTLNEGRLMPDGRRLTRASLIHPGWILRLPADAVALELDRPHAPTSGSATPAPPAPAAAEPSGAVAHHQPTAQDSSTAPALKREPFANGTDRSGDRTQARPTSVASPPDAAGSGASHADDKADGPVAPAVLVSLLGLASVGAVQALSRRRRVAARRRPAGVRAARPAEPLRALEAQLLQQARRAEDTAATVQLALQIASRHAAGSRLRAVWQHPDGGFELVLTEPATSRPAPAPFEATDQGWLLPPTALKYVTPYREPTSRRPDSTEPTPQTAADPFPLLLPVGSRNGSACLVNLELYGLISLVSDNPDRDAHTLARLQSSEPSDGDRADVPGQVPATVPGLVGSWVQALDAAPWADRVRTYLPTHLGPLTTGRTRLHLADHRAASGARHDDRPQPTSALNAHERQVVTDCGSLEAARRADPDAALVGLTLHAGYRSDELPTELLSAATDPCDPNIVVLTGAHPDAHAWQLDRNGLLHIPGVADDLQPLTIDPEQQQVLLRLLEHAQDPPQAPADDPDHAALLADCPPLAPPAEPTASTPGVPPATVDSQPGVIDPTEAGAPPPDPSHQALGDGAASVPPPAAEPPLQNGPPPGPEPVGDDPADQDITPAFVEVCVLGPVTVHGTDEPLKRQHAIEALTYLALHRRPVRLELLWTALFPHKPYDNKQLGNRLSDLRRSIGTRLVRVTTSTYELDDRVVTDWQRFQGLAGGNPQQQLEALALVRGRPFDGSPLDWFQLEGQYAEIEASIVDLALQVGERALRTRDYDTARTAALAGLRGCPWEERLYRIAMQSAAARGAGAELHQLRRQLQIVLDDELDPDDDIQPATQDLYTRLRDEEERRRRVEERRVSGG